MTSEHREVAVGAGGAGFVVDGDPDVHPLVQAVCVGATVDPGAAKALKVGHDVFRWNQHPRPPEGRRGASKEDHSHAPPPTVVSISQSRA